MSENVQSLEGVCLDKGEIELKRLEKNKPEGAKEYSKSIYELIPRVKFIRTLQL